MAKDEEKEEGDDEIKALTKVAVILKKLSKGGDPNSVKRVLAYVAEQHGFELTPLVDE